MSALDTIAAIATPPGRGGIAVIRVSGPEALKCANTIAALNPEPRRAYYRKFRNKDGETVDEGLVIYFPGPNSYTGEDIVEFQGHAGNISPQRVLKTVLSVPGVRQAEPGEFTRRAFLNNKMDLTAAEAVEDLISAGSESAARAAMTSLDGVFAQQTKALSAELTDFRVRLEACLDFPEEHEDFFDSGRASEKLNGLIKKAEHALTVAGQGVKLNEGVKIVLAGAPNAGKSSLLNALAGVDKAIVTNIPGTTRDVLSCEIEIHGVPVTIIDTAGIRDKPSDEIEAIGIKKAVDELIKADLVLFMIDGSADPHEAHETFKTVLSHRKDLKNLLIIVSKSDKEPNQKTRDLLLSPQFMGLKKVNTSTKIEDGLKALKETLTEALGILPVEGVFSARRRHTEALELALGSIRSAAEILQSGDLVLCAQELMQAQEELGLITGRVTSDDILGKIFSTFCIGK